MGYTHRKIAENSQTTVYERTDEGLFGWPILAASSKDYVAIDNLTGAAVSGSTVGEARIKLEQLEEKNAARTTSMWRGNRRLVFFWRRPFLRPRVQGPALNQAPAAS